MGSVTQHDLIEALRKAMAPQPDGGDAYSGAELAELMGVHPERVCKVIRWLLRNEKAEAVQVRRPDISGRIQTKIGYRLKT